MLNRKIFPDNVKRLGTCQATGDTGVLLVHSKGDLVIPEIKAERDRTDFRPTDQEKYEKWKEDFDVFTQNQGD